MKNERPAISVVVPCRNEKAHIESCIRSVLSQEIRHGQIEFIVVDGMSVDGTRNILSDLCKEDSRLQVIDNPAGITPCAMNVGIRAAKGRFIAILGAHTEYSSNYLKVCVEILEEHPEACCSGGPIISRGRSHWGRAIAIAMSHPVGVGNAKHRFPDYEGYAEGACYPVFRREIFDRVGFYDENLVRNQDDELNRRIALNGEKVFLSPRAKCIYYVREKISHLSRQYYQYGYYRVAVLKKHRLPQSFRQIVPVVFFSAMGVLLIGLFILPGWWAIIGLILPSIYLTILVFGGLGVGIKEGFLVGLLFPITAFVMHISYALGFAWGIQRIKSSNE